MNDTITTLLSLEQALRDQGSLDELAFFMTHQTRLLFPYKKAIVWSGLGQRNLKIESISNLAELDHQSPYHQRVIKMLKELMQKPGALTAKKLSFLKKTDLSKEVQALWPEHLAENLAVYPYYHEGTLIGGILLGVDEFPNDLLTKQLEWLFDVYNYSWRLLNKKGQWFGHLLSRFQADRRTFMILGLVTVLVFLIRIPQTVMAPVTVIPKDPVIVTAPMDGAIESVHIALDQNIEQGQLLLSMEKRDLLNQHELALRELDTAKAKLASAVQSGFKNIDERAGINALEMETKEKQLKVDYTAYLLQEADIRSSEDGIAIIDDPDHWIGRPVSIGEKIMQVGRRDQIQFEVFLPVSDAIEFKQGDGLQVYLTDDPLQTLRGHVKYASFEAVMTPKQVLAYRIVASFDSDQKVPRLGSQGTAKIIGKRVSVFYYLFRRPIGFIRQTLGW